MHCSIGSKSRRKSAGKKFKGFYTKYGVKDAVRVSMSGFREQDWLTNFPLYNIGDLNRYLKGRGVTGHESYLF